MSRQCSTSSRRRSRRVRPDPHEFANVGFLTASAFDRFWLVAAGSSRDRRLKSVLRCGRPQIPKSVRRPRARCAKRLEIVVRSSSAHFGQATRCACDVRKNCFPFGLGERQQIQRDRLGKHFALNDRVFLLSDQNPRFVTGSRRQGYQDGVREDLVQHGPTFSRRRGSHLHIELA